jgi:hypothetical protein
MGDLSGRKPGPGKELRSKKAGWFSLVLLVIFFQKYTYDQAPEGPKLQILANLSGLWIRTTVL